MSAHSIIHNQEQQLEIVSFQSVMAELKIQHEIPDATTLVGDVFEINRTNSGLRGVEIIWADEFVEDEAILALRGLVPKAVLEYAERNRVSLIEDRATMGHVAVLSESLGPRRVARILAGKHLLLGMIKPGHEVNSIGGSVV